jgi:20S proteasome subunit alpha 6
MFRNNYDNDSVTFSPQGRIFQVEYAQEAVKQGSVVVGVVSKTHAVLAAIKVSSKLLGPEGSIVMLEFEYDAK